MEGKERENTREKERERERERELIGLLKNISPAVLDEICQTTSRS